MSMGALGGYIAARVVDARRERLRAGSPDLAALGA